MTLLFPFQKGPLRLYYTVFTNQAKRFKSDIEEDVPMETDVTNASDLKTETSGYISDDEKIVSENERSLSQESNDSKHDSVLEGDGIDIEHKAVTIGDTKTKEKSEERPESAENVKEQPLAKNVEKDNKDQFENKSAMPTTKVKNKLDSAKDDARKPDAQTINDSKSERKQETMTVLPEKQKDSCDSETEKEIDKSDTKACKMDVNLSKNDHVDSKAIEENKQSQDEIVGEHSAPEIKKPESKVKPEMVEASTGTNGISATNGKCNIGVSKQCKSIITDEDISEPVVSSTQNTQGCQTEAPGSSSPDTLDIPHSSEADRPRSAHSPSCKSTVDVSCETDNFVLSRKMSVDSVSVSTETEIQKSEIMTNSKRLVDCSTDVFDFPKSEEIKKKTTVDCSTDFDGFPADSTKTNTLTVDCSTSIENLQTTSHKRKSIDIETHTEPNKSFKKSESKSYKRSYSYAGHLSTPKAAYLAQPLSPTKMKFTSPKSPVKTPPNIPAPKSPSRAEPSGFQSQYQSFVKTEINYRFEDEDTPTSIKPVILQKSDSSSIVSLSQSLPPTQKKSQSKTGRPRGRPPKNRSLDSLPPPKEKKHKSRSHSPKHRKTSEKDKDRTSSLGGIDKLKIKSVPAEQAKPSTAYAWINKIDNGQKQTSDKKGQKSKSNASEKNPSDLRIPKQFLYFSNGQYTIATVSSLSTLKQSSPVSPPPKTVFTADMNSKNKNKIINSENSKKQKYQDTSHQVKQNESKIAEKCERKEQVSETMKSMSKPEKSPKYSNKDEDQVETHTVHKIDSNQNKITKTSVESEKQVIDVKSTGGNSETNKETSKDINKDTAKEKPTVSVPEYRHQSPFFASISNAAKLQAPHRPAAHLNVPNLNSHFSGTHHLYSQGRYTNDRLGTPIYRSFSMTDKSPAATMASKYEEARRLEALASATQCGYLGPFPAPYLGLMHNHLVSSLPPPPPLSKQGHFPDSTRSLSFSESLSNCSNTLSQNTAKLLTKTSNTTPKGKEKSIDRIISAITEMRTKKETQEQLNGIDLSTKSSRQLEKPKETMNESKTDKFEFTDEDDTPRPQKMLSKPESVPRKDAL